MANEKAPLALLFLKGSTLWIHVRPLSLLMKKRDLSPPETK
jgi:hypothetical protein